MTAPHLSPSKKRHGHGIDCSCVTRGEQCEKAFAAQVREYAERNGYLVYQTPTWRRTAATAGFPDLVLAGYARLILVELKRDSEQLTVSQHKWRAELVRDPCEFYVWRPHDWPAIEDRLRRPPAPKRLPPRPYEDSPEVTA